MQILNTITYPFEGQYLAALFFDDAGETRIILGKGETPTSATYDVYNKYLDDPYSHAEKVTDADAEIDAV